MYPSTFWKAKGIHNYWFASRRKVSKHSCYVSVKPPPHGYRMQWRLSFSAWKFVFLLLNGRRRGTTTGHILTCLGIPAKRSIFMLPKNTPGTYISKENIFLTLPLSTCSTFFAFISFHRIMSHALLGQTARIALLTLAKVLRFVKHLRSPFP